MAATSVPQITDFQGEIDKIKGGSSNYDANGNLVSGAQERLRDLETMRNQKIIRGGLPYDQTSAYGGTTYNNAADVPQDPSAGGGGGGGGGGGSSGGATFDQDQMINNIYDAQTTAKTKALEAAYQQNVDAANAAKAAIPGTYNDARNSTAAQSAIGQQNFNEQASARGLNSGTGSQAALAMNDTLQSNISNLDKQQAKDISAVDLQLAQLKAKYNGDIAAAVADGQFQKAQALYNKYMTDQQNALEQKRFDAQMSASNDAANYNRSISYAQLTGDYSSLSPWWTHQAIKNAVSTNASTMRQQKSSANDIAVYLTKAVNGGSISQQEAAEIMQSLGLTYGG